jgi:WD40 repeat protein
MEGYVAPVSVTLSPDGKKVVAEGGNKTICIWDTETGKKLKKFEIDIGQVLFAVFSSDGKKVVAGGSNGNVDNSVTIWDVESGKILHKLEGHKGWVSSAAFSSDGKKLITGGRDNIARIWDLERLPPPVRPAIGDF